MPNQTVSVIIPTYNRKDYLRDTLDSLAAQTFPKERFEVIIVDDGSLDGTDQIHRERFPFSLRYLKQANQGDAAARNNGARNSQADLLVFLDDDMIVAPDFLSQLLHVYTQDAHRNEIVVGTAKLWLEHTNPLAHPGNRSQTVLDGPSSVEIPFAEVCSNNMSVARDSYLSLGMMHDLDFPGSSIWCDVDFAYRAYRRGFSFRQSTHAICWHRDYTAQTLESRSKRMHTVAYRAVALLQKYPELLEHLPMFADKTPLSWRRDSLWLIVRKLARRAASSRPALWGMEQLAGIQVTRSTGLDHVLSRWIIGAYIFRGYRDGLSDLRLQERPKRPPSTMLSS